MKKTFRAVVTAATITTAATAALAGDFSDAGCASVHRVYEAGNAEILQECPRDLAEIRPRARPQQVTRADLTMRPRLRPDDLETPELLASDVEVENPFEREPPSPWV